MRLRRLRIWQLVRLVAKLSGQCFATARKYCHKTRRATQCSQTFRTRFNLDAARHCCAAAMAERSNHNMPRSAAKRKIALSCRWWGGQAIGSRYSTLHQVSFPVVVVVMPHESCDGFAVAAPTRWRRPRPAWPVTWRTWSWIRIARETTPGFV